MKLLNFEIEQKLNFYNNELETALLTNKTYLRLVSSEQNSVLCNSMVKKNKKKVVASLKRYKDAETKLGKVHRSMSFLKEVGSSS